MIDDDTSDPSIKASSNLATLSVYKNLFFSLLAALMTDYSQKFEVPWRRGDAWFQRNCKTNADQVDQWIERDPLLN